MDVSFITVNAQNSIRIDANGTIIYVDPYQIDEEIHDADFIFITHDHYDHFSLESINKILQRETAFVVPIATYGFNINPVASKSLGILIRNSVYFVGWGAVEVLTETTFCVVILICQFPNSVTPKNVNLEFVLLFEAENVTVVPFCIGMSTL